LPFEFGQLIAHDVQINTDVHREVLQLARHFAYRITGVKSTGLPG
jgi:hypothetical protein